MPAVSEHDVPGSDGGESPAEVLGRTRNLASPGRRSPLIWLLLGVIVAGGVALATWLPGRSSGSGAAPPPPPPPRLTVQVVSMPPGAAIWIDDVRQPHTTPATLQVPLARKLTVRLELAGYTPHREVVTPAKGLSQVMVSALLRPATPAPSDGGAAREPPLLPDAPPSH